MKGILGFTIWLIIGVLAGIKFEFHGVVDILVWPVCVVFRIWQWMNGEEWDE